MREKLCKFMTGFYAASLKTTNRIIITFMKPSKKIHGYSGSIKYVFLWHSFKYKNGESNIFELSLKLLLKYNLNRLKDNTNMTKRIPWIKHQIHFVQGEERISQAPSCFFLCLVLYKAVARITKQGSFSKKGYGCKWTWDIIQQYT